MKYSAHILEIKNRLIKVILFVFSLFIFLFYFSNDIYDLVIHLKSSDLQLVKLENNIKLSKLHNSIIATSITATLITPLKLSFIISLLLSIPYILYQILSFVTPGLYKRERQFLYPFIFSSFILFYLGLFFSYFIICPFTIQFLRNCAPESVMVMTDMNNILSFILNISFVCGLLFQVPIIILLLLHFQIISNRNIQYLRPYVIISAFIIGMLITPPDIISQVIVAIPILVLFELTIILSKIKNYFYKE